MTTKQLLDEYAGCYREIDICENDAYICELCEGDKKRMQEIIQELEASIGKQYGGCTNCYGKGYCTNINVATGRGISYPTPYYLPCECGRGKQIEEMQASIRKEVAQQQQKERWVKVFDYHKDLASGRHPFYREEARVEIEYWDKIIKE